MTEQPKRELRKELTIRSLKTMGFDLSKLISKKDPKMYEQFKSIGFEFTWDFLINFANSMIVKGEPFTEDSPFKEFMDVVGLMGQAGFLVVNSG